MSLQSLSSFVSCSSCKLYLFMCVCLKELERSVELSNSSYQRQLAAERKKTISAQEEIRTLQDELQQLTNKLKVQKLCT